MINLLPLQQQPCRERMRHAGKIFFLTLCMVGMASIFYPDFSEKPQALIKSDPDLRLYEFLSQLPQTMPDELYFIHITWKENIGTLYGQAHHHDAIRDFLQNLNNNSYFKKIELISSDEQHYFTIHFYG